MINRRVNRFEIIDLLRGLAILLVVLRHVQLRIPFEETELLVNLSNLIFSAIFVSGNEGVRIFFVISGFLITLNCLVRYSDLNRININEFYKFRFARIAPCLIALVIILSALHFLGVKSYVINARFSYSETLFSAFAFHLNWLEGMKGYLPPSWDVLWSLSVEEVFYIVFPLVCLISRRKSVIYTALIVLIIVGPFNRFFLEGNNVWQTKAYLSCMDSIAIGCLFALLSHKKTFTKSVVRTFSVIGAAFVIFVLLVKKDPSFSFLSDLYLFKTTLSFGVGLLLISATRQRLMPFFSVLLSPLVMYGRLSYEIYLTHMFVVIESIRFYKIYKVDLNHPLIFLVGVLIVSGLLGYLVERYFSKPMNLWIRNR